MSVRYDELWPTTQENFNRNLVDFLADPLFPKIAVEDDPNGTPDANTLYKGLIPKAWLHYDQTGTPAILDDENIDTVADNATGKFTTVFLRSMSGADAWVAAALTGNAGANFMSTSLFTAPTATGVQFLTRAMVGDADTDGADNMLIFLGRQA